MKVFKKVLCSVLMFTMLIGRAEESQDNLTRLNTIPSQGLTTRITSYISEHTVCMLIIGGMLTYIYAKSVLDAMKPNPYEVLLKEVLLENTELKEALLTLTPVYRLLAPAFKLPL